MWVVALALAATVGADACNVSADEGALKLLANNRRVGMGDVRSFGIVESTATPVGCGVWKIEVSPDGSVSEATLVRTDAVGPYERYTRSFVLTQTYRPELKSWSGIVVIVLAEPED